MTELICTEPGIGIELGTTFQVLSENGSEWEILLGNEYRRVNKRSGCIFRPIMNTNSDST